MRRSPNDDLAAAGTLLDGLSADALAILAAAPRRRFRRGETLWTAGSDPGGVHVVLAGRVRVTRAPGGRVYAVHTEGAGGTLGEVPFFAGGRYPATAVALEPTTCLVIGAATLARAMAADPALAWLFLERLARRVRTLVARLDDRAGATVEQRVARLLLDRARDARGEPFPLGATQKDAAEELGTVREVIVRTLTRFRRAGLVHTPAHGRYRVANARALERIANGD